MSEKKYTGYGYHGGGRKPKAPEKRHRTNVTICGTLDEISKLKALAKEAGKSTSRYVLDNLAFCKFCEEEERKHKMARELQPRCKEALADKIKDMYDEGHSYREIAHLLNLRYDEVSEVLNGYEPKETTD